MNLCARINLTSEETISIEAERKKHGSWGTLLRWWSQYIVIIVRAHPCLTFNVDETSLSMKPVAARIMLLFMRKSKQTHFLLQTLLLKILSKTQTEAKIRVFLLFKSKEAMLLQSR